jgi:hypothetical protein
MDTFEAKKSVIALSCQNAFGQIRTGDLSRVRRQSLYGLTPAGLIRDIFTEFHQKKKFDVERESLKPRKRFRKRGMPPFRCPVLNGNMSSVRTTALSLENRTSEDIEENGIFGISPEEEIEEGGFHAASFEEIEEEIEEGNRRIFGISREEEIEGGGIQAASFEEIEEEEFQAEHGNAAEDDGGIQEEKKIMRSESGQRVGIFLLKTFVRSVKLW